MQQSKLIFALTIIFVFLFKCNTFAGDREISKKTVGGLKITINENFNSETREVRNRVISYTIYDALDAKKAASEYRPSAYGHKPYYRTPKSGNVVMLTNEHIDQRIESLEFALSMAGTKGETNGKGGGFGVNAKGQITVHAKGSKGFCTTVITKKQAVKLLDYFKELKSSDVLNNF